MSSLPSVQAGQCVVLQRCGYMKMHTLATEPPFNVNVGKEMVVDLSGAIGKSFGTTFKMMMDGIATNDKGKNARKKRAFGLQEVSERVDVESLFVDPEESSSETNRDNRSLLDQNSSQALSRDDIESMKAEGKSAVDIVTELVDKSSSFANKTKFSQAKFLKKKANKYSEYLIVRRPSIRLLAQIMYATDPLKIMNLRVDSLSQLLNQANVRAGGNFIVYESGCQGLVVAAALERLAGADGKLVHIYQSGNPQVQHLNAMNFDESVKRNLVMLNMYHLRALERGEDIAKMHTNVPSCSADEAFSEGNNDGATSIESNGQNEADGAHAEPAEAPAKKVPYRQQMREQSLAAFELMKSRSMDGLVIVSRQHSTALLMALLPYLAPSRSFAVYSPYKEPLLDAYLAVKESGSAVMVTLSETWLRQYQVLPERTHPKVQMSGGGGYVLSGIVVEKTDSASFASSAKQNKNKRAKLG